MGRNTAIALIAIGIGLNNLAYLKDLIVGDDLYIGWKAWLGIVAGIVATIAGVVALARPASRPAS